MKLRHLPVIVDAVIWDDTAIVDGGTKTYPALDELHDLGLSDGDYHLDLHGGLVLHTVDGDRTAMPGDAVVKGVLGEFYPVKRDVLARVYKPVDDAEGESLADNYQRHFGTKVAS